MKRKNKHMKRITNIICPAFALFALACFALSTANADQPNHPQVPIAFTANPGQCAPEQVKVSGVLQLHFKKQGRVVEPESANFKQFSGTGQKTRRKYVASKPDVEKDKQANFQGGSRGGAGGGEFILEFDVIGNPNPAGPAGQADACPGCRYRFTVNYKVVYTFDGKFKVKESVNELKKQFDKPKVCCNPRGCL
jgi:hypothetical protein